MDKTKKAFTLVELLVAIAIIGILASLIISVIVSLAGRNNPPQKVKMPVNMPTIQKPVETTNGALISIGENAYSVEIQGHEFRIVYYNEDKAEIFPVK